MFARLPKQLMDIVQINKIILFQVIFTQKNQLLNNENFFRMDKTMEELFKFSFIVYLVVVDRSASILMINSNRIIEYIVNQSLSKLNSTQQQQQKTEHDLYGTK